MAGHGTIEYPAGYHIWKLINAYTQAASGYGQTLPGYPCPAPGLQLGNLLGEPQEVATAVRAALAGTISAGSATVSFADHNTAPGLLGQPGLRTGQFWPPAGSALYRYAKPVGRFTRDGVREFVLGMAGDYREDNVVDRQGRR